MQECLSKLEQGQIQSKLCLYADDSYLIMAVNTETQLKGKFIN